MEIFERRRGSWEMVMIESHLDVGFLSYLYLCPLEATHQIPIAYWFSVPRKDP
jgi:hypothetical protein